VTWEELFERAAACDVSADDVRDAVATVRDARRDEQEGVDGAG
jgi:hypothetical protein